MISPIVAFAFGLVAASSVAGQQIHDITVGSANGSTTYTPNAISANPGDQVVFHFEQHNHTATQSSLAAPCAMKEGGFDSGFQFVAPNVTENFPTFTIPIQDTNPIWVYCRQGEGTPESHCGLGMVFAVNCGADGSASSFAAFQQAALAEGAALSAAASSSAALASATGAPWGTDDPSATTAAYGGATTAAPSPVEPAPTDSSVSDAPEPTLAATAPGAVHTVVVGGADLVYTPSNITANAGDVVVFEFQQKNHTATQSSFADPCHILTDATTNEVTGLDSGFMPVGANVTSGFPTWNFTVNDTTTPLWFYCKQHSPDGSSHCGAGMVFAVNAVPTSNKSFTAFQSLAMQLNGTNSSSTAPPSSSAPSNSGVVALGANIALSIGSVFAVFALVL